jgi:pyoverdine/dityrosine biosynthesis protein Dit1/AcrR family transcriptional regulator
VSPTVRLRVLEALAGAIGDRGYDGVDLAGLAAAAGLAADEVAVHFPRKELAILALYERLAAGFRETVELPDGTVAARFRAAVEGKLAVLAPFRRGLTAIARHALDPEDRLAIGGGETARVRMQVAAIFAAVVEGASDAPSDAVDRRRLAHALYGSHLLVVLAWLLDEGAAPEALALAADALEFAAMTGAMPLILARADRVTARLLPLPQAEPAAKARAILDRILLRQRNRPDTDPARAADATRAIWGERVARLVVEGRPIHLVLPGFPAKSPNPLKVLGPLPDRAESIALDSLERLCVELEELHPAGVRMTIASDGHVFGPVVGVSDAACDAYRAAIRARIRDGHLDWFDLADAFGAGTGEDLRRRLLDGYGEPVDALRARGSTALVDGVHRFLAEDELGLHPEMSKTQARNSTRDRAWETVRRSQAWGALVAAAFPDAIRLSIHPQPVGSEKIGVHLMPTDDAWLTPWHGAALLDRDGFRLVKRSDVPDARVVPRSDGNPDYLVAPGI